MACLNSPWVLTKLALLCCLLTMQDYHILPGQQFPEICKCSNNNDYNFLKWRQLYILGWILHCVFTYNQRVYILCEEYSVSFLLVKVSAHRPALHCTGRRFNQFIVTIIYLTAEKRELRFRYECLISSKIDKAQFQRGMTVDKFSNLFQMASR